MFEIKKKRKRKRKKRERKKKKEKERKKPPKHRFKSICVFSKFEVRRVKDFKVVVSELGNVLVARITNAYERGI